MSDIISKTKNAKYRDIFITSQKGLHPLITQSAAEAISEFMEISFPEYASNYPVTNLGNWKSSESTINNQQFQYLSNSEKSLCIRQTDGSLLKPFESVDWYVAFAKYKAQQDKRYDELNATTLISAMKKDPTHKKIPQIQVMVLKEGIYPNKNFNYTLGIGSEGVGFVISADKFMNNDGTFRKEEFKTVTMHEFGHVIDLTYEDRKNTREKFGPHCIDELCLMQQREDGDYSDITKIRLALKREGGLPICPDCVEAGERFFQKEREQKMYQIARQEALMLRNR
ncbi:MAG: hypothetical protein R3Y43_08000 [Alphaproteobacteria bacterium]